MPRRLAAAEWKRAALRWTSERLGAGRHQDPWTVRSAGLVLECRPAAGGQVGVFPEHAGDVGLARRAPCAAARAELERPPEILSLFAYTGGATLACARSGARVAHVDASKPAVAWARRNAELSGLADRPVRWLVDDVRDVRCAASAAAAGTTTASSSIRRRTATDPCRGRSRPTSSRCSTTSPRCSARGPSLVVLSAHTEGFDGERLAALCREHLGRAIDAAPISG